MKKQFETPSKEYIRNSYPSSNIEGISAGKFFKIKRMNSLKSNVEDTPNTYNPQSFINSCELLSDGELQEKYQTNPLFKSRIDTLLAKNKSKIKLLKRISQDSNENVQNSYEQKTGKQLRKQENEKLSQFYYRCFRVLERLDIQF